MVQLGPRDMQPLISLMEQFNLDFDDACQYLAAEKHDLTIVSFDADFDRTQRGKKTPAEIVTV